MMKRKTLLSMALSFLCCVSFAFSFIGLQSTKAAAEQTQESMYSVVQKYYTTRTLQKAGTTDEANRVTYSGLVPYGTGTISLGTYDMSASANLETPLFEVLPQKAWDENASDSLTDKYFKVYLTSGSKQIIYYFTLSSRDDATQAAVLIGDKDDNLGGHFWTSANSTVTKKVAAILPFLYNGKGPESGSRNENKESYTKPTPVGFYYNNGVYYSDFCYQISVNNGYVDMPESSEGSGKYRYAMRADWDFSKKFTAEELKNVTVSVAFDKGTVTKDEAWVMFTSIAGKKLKTDFYSEDTKYLDNKGDYFKLTTENTTLALNKQITLADNDAKTKLFEFETQPVNSSSAEISEVKVVFKGAEYSLAVRFTKSVDQQTTMILGTYERNKNLNSEDTTWYTPHRGNGSLYERSAKQLANGAEVYGKEFGYYFDGKVANTSNVKEDGSSFTEGDVIAPRFALYFDKDTKTIYTDVGRDSVGKTVFDDVNRWGIFDLGYISWLDSDSFVNDQLDVTVEVTMASGVDKTAIKLTNLDGQCLERESIESAQYKTVYHSYEAEEIVAGDKFVGATCEIPALKDNGVMAQFSNVARSAYTVKVNGVETAEDSFTLAASNKIEYYVDGDLVDTIEFEAQALQLRMKHLGAAIRYDANDTTKSGIRYTVIVNKADYDALGDKTVTMGMLSVGTQYLADGEKVNINTGATKKVVNTTFTTEECTVVVEDGVEYYQMRICVMDIPNTDFAVEVTTVGYICINGNYFYTEQKSRSISYVAKAYVEDMKGKPGYMSGVEDFIVD